MKERIQWLLVGIGVMYAMQLGVLLTIRLLLTPSGPPEIHNLLSAILGMLVAFFVGGFVIGLMAERVLIMEPILAAVAVLLIDVLSAQAGWLKGIFLFSVALQQHSYGTASIIGTVAVVSAVAGALIGERRTVPGETWIGQTLLVLGLGGLLLGPFLLVGALLPLAYLAPIGLALLAGILIAVYRYGKTPRRADAISIRPESHASSDQRAS